MLAASALRQLLRDLRSQRLRTFLTIFGIVWGTAAVSLLLAFGQGYHRQMVKSAAGLGNSIVIAWPSMTAMPFEGLSKGRRIRVAEEDIELLRSTAEGLDAVSAEFQENAILQSGAKTLRVPISGIRPVFAEMRNLIPEAGGRFINPIDVERKRRVTFLGFRLAEQVFGDEDPVGRTVKLNGSPFLVIGVMQRKIQQSNYSGPDNRRAYIPSTTFRAFTGQEFVDLFVFTAAEFERTEQVKDEVRAVLGRRHRFDPADHEALPMWDTTGSVRFLETFMLAFKLFLAIVGSLTLVVAGIGASNIMNVVVEERSREIGIKMALGAKPRFVLAQLLLETLVITAAGGALGLGIAFGACAAFPALELTDFVGDPQVSVGVAAITAALLGAIGFIAGFFPARTAARLDPVVAMKL